MSRVNVVDGVKEGVSQTQRKPQLHLGRFHYSELKLIHSLTSFKSFTAFHLMLLHTDDADVSVLA